MNTRFLAPLFIDATSVAIVVSYNRLIAVSADGADLTVEPFTGETPSTRALDGAVVAIYGELGAIGDDLARRQDESLQQFAARLSRALAMLPDLDDRAALNLYNVTSAGATLLASVTSR